MEMETDRPPIAHESGVAHPDWLSRPIPAGGAPIRDEPEWVKWWRVQAEEEIEMMRPKVKGYGAHDLEEIGRQILDLAGRSGTADEATLTGIHFYTVGKVARWAEAIREDRPVARDTLLDLVVYARMALRVHDVGAWPGQEDDSGR